MSWSLAVLESLDGRVSSRTAWNRLPGMEAKRGVRRAKQMPTRKMVGMAMMRMMLRVVVGLVGPPPEGRWAVDGIVLG